MSKSFKYPGWGEQPMGTYKQPEPNHDPLGENGYPETGIGLDATWIKGRYMAGAKQKQYVDMRGYGAATKGKKFMKG